ncbi:MAG: hypothetical protein R3B57_12040 [Phycisphaerales bacterium]
MQATTFSQDISRPVGRCAATGRELAPGEAYVAALVETPGAEALTRLDFAADAWASGARPEAPATLFAHWRSIVPEPGRPERALIGADEVMDLFEQLDGVEDPTRQAFRYVLALLLIRKRRLVYEGGRPADAKRGVEGVMYVRPWTRKGEPEAPVSEVADPGLDEETLGAVTEQIGRVMNLETDE